MTRGSDERIAVLEEQHTNAKQERDEIKADVAAIRQCTNEIKITLSKQKSFLGGIAFLATAVGFFLKWAWEYLNKLTQ